MRTPKPAQDYDMFNEGWVADCAYCEEQIASKRRAEAERDIKAHIREEHPDMLEGDQPTVTVPKGAVITEAYIKGGELHIEHDVDPISDHGLPPEDV